MGQLECGWIRAGQPLNCNNWIGDTPNSGVAPDDGSGFSSCKSYTRTAEGEAAIPETVKNWVRWRVHDFQETTRAPNDVLRFAFQSLKVEIVHGIPSSQIMLGDKAQIKMYHTQFDLTDKDLNCAALSGKESYRCTLGPVNGRINTPKVACLPLSPRCTLAVDVLQRNITMSDFSKIYQSSAGV